MVLNKEQTRLLCLAVRNETIYNDYFSEHEREQLDKIVNLLSTIKEAVIIEKP